LPQSRFWELLCGAILAYLATSNKYISGSKKWFSRFSNFFSISGLLLILIGELLIDGSKKFPGYWALLPTFGAVLLIAVGSEAYLNGLFSQVAQWYFLA